MTTLNPTSIIAKQVAEALDAHYNPKWGIFIDPFCGLLEVPYYLKNYNHRFHSDSNPALISLLNYVGDNGYYKFPEKVATPELYESYKSKQERMAKAFVGFGLSINHHYFGTYNTRTAPNGKPRDYINLFEKYLTRLVPTIRRAMCIQDCRFTKSVKTPQRNNKTIYCALPYQSFAYYQKYDPSYSDSKAWSWATRMAYELGHQVFVLAPSKPKNLRTEVLLTAYRLNPTPTNPRNQTEEKLYHIL